MKIYEKEYLNNIAFPLGGMGAGSISLAGDGRLVDAEFNNRPNRESGAGYTGFAVKAECDGKIEDCRLLCGNNKKDLMGTVRGSYGYGADFFAGVRHFENVRFESEFPMATLHFSDSIFPANIKMEAFNPFIPSNDKDSSIPAAFFQITVTSTAKKTMTFRVWENASNLLTSHGLHDYSERKGIKMLTLNGAGKRRNSDNYGNITAATDAAETSHTDYWFRGEWFDCPTKFLNALNTPGPAQNRVYEEPITKAVWADAGTLEASVELKPGESHTFRFLLSWYVPRAKVYWYYPKTKKDTIYYNNYYSTLFKNSEDVTAYCFKNWDRLYTETRQFATSLYSSTLPEEVLDAIGGNLAILKSTTCLRLEDGSFWAWEGVNRTVGSCEGTCQHVWNYAYAMPFLFPQVEKKLRANELDYSLDENGLMHLRMKIERKGYWGSRACVDGQMGEVIKCYREWKISGDDAWLREYWPKIKTCLEYAWSPKNFDKWDPEKSGLITGRQHHTLDVELFGAYAWLTGMYHAALLAAAEMADFLGEKETAAEYRSIYRKGHALLEEKSFNGEYYTQLLSVTDKAYIEKYTFDEKDFATYWDFESNQSKYQIENGCEIDQVLADWHTGLVGLPAVFDEAHRKSALESIYKYNFKPMHELLNPCRVFACNDEKGVVMCQWPEGVEKPAIPIPYSEECMTGFEYAVAATMLQSGMEDKALEIVHAVRSRYDGYLRNPFAEIECGASYARAMATYSFLLIYSGFEYNLSKKQIGFKPLKDGRYFWAVDGAWGTVECKQNTCELKVDFGALELQRFTTSLGAVQEVAHNGTALSFTQNSDEVCLNVNLQAKDTLIFKA